MWIARDKDGSLYLYRNKPYKDSIYTEWKIDDAYLFNINSSLFPEVKWEDKEPTEVELIIKK